MLELFKKWRVALIGVVISGAVLIFFATQIDLAQFGAALAGARVGYVAVAAAFIGIGLALRAARWRVLLGDALPYMRAFHILNVAYFANAVLPLRLGELARAYLASQGTPSVPPLHSLSTVVVERLLDVVAVLVLLALALAFAPLPDVLRASALLFAPLAAIGFAVLVGLASQRDRVLRWADAFAVRTGLKDRLDPARIIGPILDGVAPLTRPRPLFFAMLWTALAWLASCISGYTLMYAYYPQGDIAATLLFTAGASFAVAVPAVPGSLGTYEASVWVGLAAMGYGEPLATATAFAVTLHGLNLLLNAILGAIGMASEGMSLGQLTRGVRAMRGTPNP